MTIPNITIPDSAVRPIVINGTGIRQIRNVWTWNPSVRAQGINNIQLAELRPWETTSQVVTPLVPSVVERIGVPVVDMPGGVKVHKENVRERSRNKNLVNDDPKGNTTLCDSGMPSFQPVDYQSQGLTWTTVVPEEPEPDGVKSDPPPPPETPDTPGAPSIPPTGDPEKECPGPGDLRVGDYTTSGNEKVSGHEWNDDKTICITLYEDVGFVEKYLPSPQIVTTTATIAVVATSSALLAKPLADLLLKVIKPVVKKISAKVKKVLGKTDPVLSVRERMEEQRDRNQAIRTLKKALKSKK